MASSIPSTFPSETTSSSSPNNQQNSQLRFKRHPLPSRKHPLRKAAVFKKIAILILIISVLASAIISGVLAGTLYPFIGINSLYCLFGLVAIPLFPYFSCSICCSTRGYEKFLRAQH